MNILAFDIETIPDVEGGRKLYELDGLDDAEVAEAMFQIRRDKVGHDFLPTHLQRVVAISAVYRNTHQDKFKYRHRSVKLTLLLRQSWIYI